MGRGGSKAGGGIGKFGEGMENGKDTTAVVYDQHPLTDVISTGGGSFANEVMNTRDAMEREYGSAVKRMNLAVGKISDPSALGCYGSDTLTMAEKHVKNKYLNRAMAKAAKSGFHPSLGDKTGAESVASHEIGHRLGEVAARKAGIDQKDIVARAGKKIGIKTENVAGHISGYARSNYHETIAEAVCDVYCNGKNASRASKAITKELKAILNG